MVKCTYAQAATDQIGKRKRPPVSCKLYDARSKRIKKMGWKPEIVLNLCSELAKSLKPPPFSYLLSDQETSSVINTVIGNVPLGLTLAIRCLTGKNSQTDVLAESQQVEKVTVRQSLEPEWLFQRSKRLTASNFSKVIKRKRPPLNLIWETFVPKDLSKVPSIRDRRQQELVVRALCSRKMQKTCKQFIVFDAGLVVNSTFPYLGVSPDEKVYDPTEKDPFGLLEIKNPYTWRNHTMEEACKDPDF